MSDPRQDVISEVGRAMQRYQRSTQRFDDAVARAIAVNQADLRCLDELSEGPRTAGELSLATGLRPAATTALIDRLSDKGLVRRVASDQDRRRVLVEMTEKGAASVWAAYGPLVDEGAGLFAGVDDAQLHMLAELLDRMRELTDRHRRRVEGSS